MLLAVSACVAALLLGSVPAGAEDPVALAAGPVSPLQWPSSSLLAPRLEGWPNALRIFGADRSQTSLAVALAARGSGGFPYDSPDAASGDVLRLATAAGWWGLDVCPRAVVLVADDSSADALAASVLPDPTGRSSEPLLRRVAAADPLFDPPGGFARVDTFAAPILLTPSARSGARSMALATRLAAQDLRSGGCKAARQAIIVGGPDAVPVPVEAELLSIGYSEVFRVSGDTRYATAAAVAAALGTAGVPASAAGCDAVADAGGGVPAMSFWANSVVEWRPSPSECRLLGRTVVLADGIDGVDALAAGWWTGFWQVPVLLHDGSKSLPLASAAELSLLGVDHIIVLGGEQRIPQQIVDQAARYARATAIRVSGPDRFATSVEMAKQFGGWWPTAPGGFGGRQVCLAASAVGEASVRSWPDALVAGTWCGTATASMPQAPERTLAPVTIETPARTASYDASAGGLPLAVGASARAPSNSASSAALSATGAALAAGQAVPLLLVPAGADRLPVSVRDLLDDAFAVPAACAALVGDGAAGTLGDASAYASALATGACPQPGFAVAFGGPSVLHPGVVGEVSALLSGSMTSADEPLAVLVGAETPDPSARFGVSSVGGVRLGVGAYATRQSMAPVFHETARGVGASRAGRVQVCLPRGAYASALWLVVESSPAAPLAVVDVPARRWYLADASGVVRVPGVGTPACIGVPEASRSPLLARAVDPNGRTSHSLLLAADVSRHFSIDGVLTASLPEVQGLRSDVIPDGPGVTRWRFETGAAGADAVLDGASSAVESTVLSVDLRHRTPTTIDGVDYPRPSTFTAAWTVRTTLGTVIGAAEGEAVLREGQWHLRGATHLAGGSWAAAALGRRPQTPTGAAPTEPPPLPGEPVTPLRAGTLDGYGAGGFAATLTVNGQDNRDDTITWHPEAFINTP